MAYSLLLLLLTTNLCASASFHWKQQRLHFIIICIAMLSLLLYLLVNLFVNHHHISNSCFGHNIVITSFLLFILVNVDHTVGAESHKFTRKCVEIRCMRGKGGYFGK
jgi:hypothetical protein